MTDSPPAAWLGVDVAVARLHVAVLSLDGAVTVAEVAPGDLAAHVRALPVTPRGAAVDAPAAWADDAHAGDERVAAKFRRRCAEAVLAQRTPAHYVSWPSPGRDEHDAAAHGWVAVGLAVHDRLRSLGVPVDECWPHASWQRLTDRRRLPSKRTPDGLALRRSVLAAAGLGTTGLDGAGHDHLDAVVAAFTAATVDDAEHRRAACPDPTHPQRRLGIVLPTRDVL